jgi:hypothetical protein
MIRALYPAGSLRIVSRGSVADVRMTEDVYDEYMQAIDGNDKISVKRSARLTRYFGEFCNNMDYYMRMGQDKFKKEGNFPDGNGGVVAVWEFKAFQWRLYGGVTEVGGRRCFVGVAVDPDKKRDRADQQLLAAAAKRLGGFFEFTSRTEGRRR